MEKPRQPKVRDAVIFFNEYSVECPALLEAVHGEVGGNEEAGWWTPCVNLVFITPDESKTDDYGRQKEHRSSCSHVSNQKERAGHYWCFPEEVEVSRPLPRKTQM